MKNLIEAMNNNDHVRIAVMRLFELKIMENEILTSIELWFFSPNASCRSFDDLHKMLKDKNLNMRVSDPYSDYIEEKVKMLTIIGDKTPQLKAMIKGFVGESGLSEVERFLATIQQTQMYDYDAILTEDYLEIIDSKDTIRFRKVFQDYRVFGKMF